jgi:NAD(P)-dependent dehydrogenase (short-subunit alcohol dehydrogenase family)
MSSSVTTTSTMTRKKHSGWSRVRVVTAYYLPVIQDAAHCRHVIEAAVAAFGRMGILVDNAAFASTVSRPDPSGLHLIPSTMPTDKSRISGASQVPMKRPGQPRELAPIYVMLAMDEASYVSGATIAVTGGKPFL